MAAGYIEIAGRIYRTPVGWQPSQGVPIYEYLGPKSATCNAVTGCNGANNPTNPTMALPSWVWLAGGALILFMLMSGGKGRR